MIPKDLESIIKEDLINFYTDMIKDDPVSYAIHGFEGIESYQSWELIIDYYHYNTEATIDDLGCNPAHPYASIDDLTKIDYFVLSILYGGYLPLNFNKKVLNFKILHLKISKFVKHFRTLSGK